MKELYYLRIDRDDHYYEGKISKRYPIDFIKQSIIGYITDSQQILGSFNKPNQITLNSSYQITIMTPSFSTFIEIPLTYYKNYEKNGNICYSKGETQIIKKELICIKI